MKTNTTTMTDTANIEHANSTNPCQGICVTDDNTNFCIGCMRTIEERNDWYKETNEWREQVLTKLKEREDAAFGGSSI
jgi:predicted Fe-S protein YdhL (DUF1289 family)